MHSISWRKMIGAGMAFAVVLQISTGCASWGAHGWSGPGVYVGARADLNMLVYGVSGYNPDFYEQSLGKSDRWWLLGFSPLILADMLPSAALDTVFLPFDLAFTAGTSHE